MGRPRSGASSIGITQYWLTGSFPNGTHTIPVIVEDTKSSIEAAPVSVIVQNP
jgi:hypothetical protein